MRRAALSLLLAAGLAAAPPAKLDRQSLRVPFWLSEGQPLAAPELQLKVNGKPVRVTRLMREQDDLLLLLVVDWAGDLSLVDPAREALIEEMAKLPPNVSVALMRAQDGVRVLLDPGAGHEKIAEALKTLAVTGRAGLLNAVEPVQQLGDRVAAKSKVRVAALFVSDSAVGNYREDYTNPVVNSSDSGDMSRRFPEALIQEKARQLARRANSGDTPLFIVQLNYSSDRLSSAYQTGIQDIAAASGGSAEFCRSLAEIPAAISKTMQAVRSLHSVEAEWQPDKAKQMEVSLEAEGRRLQFRSRRQAPERRTTP